MFILPVAIKVQHEPEIVLAGRTASVQQHERIHRIFVTIAERVGGCIHAQQRPRCSITHDDFVRSRV
jgi:hypothetical protein